MQSAGPFTLKPGALNYITVGIPFAQATNGDNWSSVQLLRQIDDVCQRLFENCFKVLDGPDAPTLTAQELENEVILYLTYENPNSNNYGESYIEPSSSIPSSYTDERGESHAYDIYYRFEGYQIYQLKDANCSIADIDDPTKAALVAQCDIENYYDSLVYAWDKDDNGDSILVGTPNESPSLGIGTLVNYTQDTRTGILTGSVKVTGSNTGIQHVFRITKDQFATGANTNLVNNREYYYVAIAYAHNRYKEYSQTDPSYLDGQKEPYLAGRKNEKGGSITPITVIPHNPVFEDGGKVAQSEFGMCPQIIRLGGYGNGGSVLRLTQPTIDTLLMKAPGSFSVNISSAGVDRSVMTNPCIAANPSYEENYGPVNVRVIDPLKIHEGRFNILFINADKDTTEITNSTRWCIVREGGGHVDSSYVDGHWTYRDTIWSDFEIGRFNEQLFLDMGLAVTLVNPKPIASEIQYVSSTTSRLFLGNTTTKGALLGSSMVFADENKQWLSGVADNDSYFIYNWIRSGAQYAGGTAATFTSTSGKYSVTEPYLDEDYFHSVVKGSGLEARWSEEALDKDQVFESVVYGLWGPYGLTSIQPFHPGFNFTYYMANDDSLANHGVDRNQLERKLMLYSANKALNYSSLNNLPSVQIVFTADTSKWTRCPVIEMCDDFTQSEGNARRFSARRHKSVDKLGNTLSGAATATDLADPNSPAYISEYGMGWFPGYAINTVTGERLNIMFGEDSRYVQHNGADMMWNPDASLTEGTQNYVIGGRHYIYVMNATTQPFRNMRTGALTTTYYTTPSYDAGRWAMQMLSSLDRLMKTQYVLSGNYFLNYGLSDEQDAGSTATQLLVRDSVAMLYASVAWVNMPLVSSHYQFTNPMDIPCDVTVNIDVRTPYGTYMSPNRTTSINAGTIIKNHEMPAYQFVLTAEDAVVENLATRSNARQDFIDSLLGQINVVPNPYYSYSSYETASQLETKVRIINLPTGEENGVKQGCTIRIYTVDGTLVRTLGPTAITRDASIGAENTTVDWDLHNQSGIPIAGGMYLIHVTVPGIGERVIKWFGTMRPVDLNSFGF